MLLQKELQILRRVTVVMWKAVRQCWNGASLWWLWHFLR